MTAVFVLSGTSNCGTPSIAASARTWASIQSGSACVQLACAKVKLEAPKHGDEDLRHADFPGEPVNDDRDPVARVIDEQPFARRVRLPHRRRQLCFKTAIEFAKPRIAVTAGVGRDIFVPDDQQSDVLALQLSMDRGPIRLGIAAMSPFASA